MKKTILTVSILAFIVCFNPSNAQNGKSTVEQERPMLTVEEIARKKTDQAVKMLGLTKKQEESMYNINLKHAQDQKAMRNERQALKKKVIAEKVAYKKALDGLLTVEQKEKLAIEKAKKLERKKNRKKPAKSASPKH